MTEEEYIDYSQEVEADGETDDIEGSICPTCSGSGEGRYEGSTCSACKGKGEV